MKFQRIFALEFSYQIRRAVTWLYFAFVLGFTFLVVIGNYMSDAQEGYFLLNGPIVIATVAVLGIVHWLLVGASVAGDAATRDMQTRMHSLTFTAPTSKAAYLGGRFLAAFALNVLILLAIPAAILIAIYLSGVEAEILGPFRLAAYLTTYFYIVLPNAFFATAIQFSLAALSRRAMGSYLGGALLFVAAYVFGMVLQDTEEWGILVDPMSFTPVMSNLTNWSPLERDTRLLLLEGSFLANRLLWLSVSLGMLAFTYVRFRLALPETGRKQTSGKLLKPDVATPDRLNWGTGKALPNVRGTYGFATHLRQLRLITWKSFLQLAKSVTGLPLLAALALLMGATIQGNLKSKGVPLLPRTDFVLDLLTAPLTQPEPFWIIIALLTIYYAGELVWRERETGLSEIANAAPVPEWVLFLSRFLAPSLVLMVWHAFLITVGIVAQAALGGSYPEIGLYLQVIFGLQLVDCLLFALLAVFVHVLVNQKFVAHLVALIAYSFIAYASNLGIDHKLFLFASSPRWSYTDMAGFGSSLIPWLWFKVYWVAWALLLAVLVRLFWVRERESSFTSRLHLARLRFTRSTAMVFAAAVASILLFGGYIFYNTNVLHDYKSASETRVQSATYEQRYRQCRNVPQPLLTGVNLKVEMYPKLREVEIRGTYFLINNNPVPIDSILLATGAGLETDEITFDQPARQVLADEEQSLGIYVLAKPLYPGDSLKLSFRVHFKAQGFSNSGADTYLVGNGSNFRNYEWLPVLGYQPYREIDEAGARKASGLTPRPATASLYNVEARQYTAFPEQINFEAVAATDMDQVVVAPGSLRRTWTKNGRRYFHYVSDAPIQNEYNFFSAKYAMHVARWKDVTIEIFYPPGRTENLERMVRSVKASLDYYSKQFGRYPYRQLRFVSYPGYGMGNHAAPINTTAEEGFFLLDPKNDPRGFDLVTAVVAHEVSHQWWGNQLKPANVEGAGLITESLAWYSAIGVLEEHYGPGSMQRLLSFLQEENENPRTRAALPLLQANDWYQNYRKGPLALYGLSQYIGRKQVNEALHRLFQKHSTGTKPFPTSLDLYRELEEVTPDSLQSLLHDLFKANTFWDFEAEQVTATQTKSGNWQVTLNVSTSKMVVDSSGVETKVPMNDWIEVGVFGEDKEGGERGAPIYLQKHRLRSGTQTVTVTVPRKPARAGIDPRHLMIDWKMEDNFGKVKIGK
ncbi:ABC transporter permease [Flavihumibacter sp. R14]|nr:ABC transporter permease [Flavihumibacter soli]